MRVYHGSLEIVNKLEILAISRAFDYGSGFYTTTEQAGRWVRRKLDTSHHKRWINIYEWDSDKAKGLNILRFDSQDEDWLDFVMNNRTDIHYHHDYDIVYGPVTDDRVYGICFIRTGLFG